MFSFFKSFIVEFYSYIIGTKRDIRMPENHQHIKLPKRVYPGIQNYFNNYRRSLYFLVIMSKLSQHTLWFTSEVGVCRENLPERSCGKCPGCHIKRWLYVYRLWFTAYRERALPGWRPPWPEVETQQPFCTGTRGYRLFLFLSNPESYLRLQEFTIKLSGSGLNSLVPEPLIPG